MDPLSDFLANLTPEQIEAIKKKKKETSQVDFNKLPENLSQAAKGLSGINKTFSRADENNPIETVSPSLVDMPSLTNSLDGKDISNSISNKLTSLTGDDKGGLLDKVSGKVGGAAGALDLVGSGASLVNAFKGGQFSQDIDEKLDDGLSPYIQSATNGFAAGNKLGGPIGGGIGAAVGIIGTAVGKKKAIKGRFDKYKTRFEQEDELDRKTIDEEYKTEEGKASLLNLKSLREKQLGI